MKALMLTAIKEQKLVEVPIPTIAKPDWVLLKVRSVGVCGSDLHGYLGHTGRRIPPLIMGHEVCAEVVEVGESVRDIKPGDLVALLPMVDQGQHGDEKDRIVLGMNAPGAYAEYLTWPASHCYPLPDGLNPEAAALAEPLAICVHAVSHAPIRPYDSAFIVGAGPIGLLTLAVLRSTGVKTIFVSDMSDDRLARARLIGADVVINPARENPRARVNEYTRGRGVEIAFEAVGNSAACQQTLEVTRDRGTVIWIGNSERMVHVDMQMIVTRELRVLGSYGMSSQDFQRTLHMLADGLIPVGHIINRRASIDEGPGLFDELLAQPTVVKCVINFD